MNKLQRQRHSGRNISPVMLIVAISVVFMLVGAILWILNIEDVVKGPWSNILAVVFTFLGSIYALLQWHAQLLDHKPLDSTHPVPTCIQSDSRNIIDAHQSSHSVQRSYTVHIHMFGSMEVYTQDYQRMRGSRNEAGEQERYCQVGEHVQEHDQQKLQELARQSQKDNDDEQ